MSESRTDAKQISQRGRAARLQLLDNRCEPRLHWSRSCLGCDNLLGSSSRSAQRLDRIGDPVCGAMISIRQPCGTVSYDFCLCLSSQAIFAQPQAANADNAPGRNVFIFGTAPGTFTRKDGCDDNDVQQAMNGERLVCVLKSVTAFAMWIAACTTPNPNYRPPRSDSGIDPTSDAATCTANQPLRCDSGKLVRCNVDGSAEVMEPCALGCHETEIRCLDVDPSNGLSMYLDQASGQLDLDLGVSATINTDTGEVKVDDRAVTAKTEVLAQSGAPPIRVLIVRSLLTNNVVAAGTSALAIVSNGDIRIDGTFEVSAKGITPGPGAFDDNACKGKVQPPGGGGVKPGVGGGGFGTPGGPGGSARNAVGVVPRSAGGTISGNATLVPLRGGCSGGDAVTGGGGGAIQLVSRSRIVVGGRLAANGSVTFGAGSGGGILLEAPAVEIGGRVVANGAAGGNRGDFGCGLGADGGFDGTPAAGGAGCPLFGGRLGAGGNGAALYVEATAGEDVDISQAPVNSDAIAQGGNGGGGAGRIRFNTAPGGQRTAGLVSPNATTGTLATR